MDAISNLAGAAQKAIFGSGITGGEGGEEPVAGVQGAGTANEPFDKGNDETVTENNSNDEPSNAQPAETTGDPSSGVSGVAGSDKHQGADAPQKEDQDNGKPKMPHTDEEREALMMKGEFPRDPNDHSGEPLQVHGGGESKEDRSASVSQEGGGPFGDKQGDGTKYVKSSGVVADGGDFDATNPGAGAEANRLLEEKGIHKDRDAPSTTEDDKSASPPVDEKSGKTSKLQKIKDKLHIK